MFRTDLLYKLYTQQQVFVMIVVLTGCYQTVNITRMTNTYCVYTVLRYSWWWTVDFSETCRVLYQNKFEK